MVERVWRNGTLLHCAGMQICVATMENGMEGRQILYQCATAEVQP